MSNNSTCVRSSGYNQRFAYVADTVHEAPNGPRFTTTRADAPRPFQRYARRSSEDEDLGSALDDDTYLEDSFCVGDEEAIEYE